VPENCNLHAKQAGRALATTGHEQASTPSYAGRTTRDRAFAPRRLGGSGLEVSALGVGTNRWRSRAAANPGPLAVLSSSLDTGVSFFDTAELYTAGRSERVLGQCCRDDGRPVVLASKFAPYPSRLASAQLHRALDGTLRRMGRESVDLYYLHFPYSLVRIESWMDQMAEAVGAGKIRAVGVSNCNVPQMRRARDALGRHGIALAANQVQYSLWHRKPEHNGVLTACRELDVALVAYRPLRGGHIRGSSGPDGHGKSGLEALGRIARDRGVTASQVALNWLLCQDECVIPIPGTTKAPHATENAGALDWRLSDSELAILAR
jgi:aryl-alcohol dehydrogenase-like predicted oxidoreductase